jgi:PAS domain S-box-containing protein
MAFTICIIVTLTVLTFIVGRNVIEERALAQISSMVAAKEDLIERSLQSDREAVALLATRADVREAIDARNAIPLLEEVMATLNTEGQRVLGVSLFDIDTTTKAEVGVVIDPLVEAPTGTILRAVVGETGWIAHDVYSPIRDSSNRKIGWLAVRFDAQALREIILATTALSETGEVLVAAAIGGELALLHHGFEESAGAPLYLGSIEENLQYQSPLAEALKGTEGVRRAEDYAGRDVYAAFRYVQSLDWALMVKVERSAVLGETVQLATFLAIIGTVFALGAALVAFTLAHSIATPVLRVSRKLSTLGPGHWGFERTVRTGDEVELLDAVITDLAGRLQTVYTHLEEEVRARTQELREQFVKDRAILESVEYGILTVDVKGDIVDVNPASCRLLGYTPDELLGSSISKVRFLARKNESKLGDSHPVLFALEKRASVRGTGMTHMNIVGKNDILLPVNFIATPLVDEGGMLGAVLLFQDMTDERRVDYIKTEFITLASHQLRTPISTLRWYLEILSGDEVKNLSETQKESLQEMQDAAKRMSNLVDALLHAAKLEGGAIEPKIEEIDAAKLVRDIAEELRTLAKDAKIACTITVPEKAITLKTDPILLHVVLQNLFSNAVKYSKAGDEVYIALIERKEGIEVTVRDSGIGIPKEQQKRLFERLFRASNAMTKDPDGNGLGLFISKMVMEILSGTISFVSEEGKGSTFSVTLPFTAK